MQRAVLSGANNHLGLRFPQSYRYLILGQFRYRCYGFMHDVYVFSNCYNIQSRIMSKGPLTSIASSDSTLPVYEKEWEGMPVRGLFSQRRIVMFCILLANYISVLASIIFFSNGALMFPFFIFDQIVLLVVNFIAAEKLRTLIILDLNLLVSAIASNIILIQLYYNNISSDIGTLLIGRIALAFAIVFVLLLSTLSVFIYKKIYK
jgi:hypothetical protein